MAVYAGLPCCSCQEQWCPQYEARLRTFGIRIRWAQLIGGYVGSGNTHLGGGAGDFFIIDPGPRSFEAAYRIAVREARRMGAPGTWHRRRNWDNRGGVEHGHACLQGCPHGRPYYGDQITAAFAGFNGLGFGGRGGRDDGPRPIPNRTWQQGIQWAQAQARKDSFMPDLTDKEQRELLNRLRRVDDNVQKIEPRTALLRRLAPGKKGIGSQGDLWPLVNAVLTGGRIDVDEKGLAKAIADSLDTNLAKSVADELAKRLKS